MFKHLVKTYSVEETQEILTTKYPESKEYIMSMNVEETVVNEAVETPEPEKAPKVKKEKAPKPEKAPKVKKEKPVKEKVESKMDKARVLFAEAEDKSRKAIVSLFMAELGMSSAAASTYYYNCKK
jgi:outer membrane biosynthesis protein TonB